MSGFTTDYKDIGNENTPIPEGEYEAIIRNAQERTTQKGGSFLSLSIVIRNDVQQDCHNRYIFENMFRKNEPSQADKQVQGYSFKRLMQIARAAKLPAGKAYETVQELCRDLLQKPVRITVYHDTYNSKVNVRVKYFDCTSFPQVNHIWKEQQTHADIQAPPSDPGFASAAQISSLDDFEEIISDGEVPF